jgi:energy-coupling factor transporter ATP-binding protein EcfA2
MPREVFRGLTLTIPQGECVGILGREGSGKSTLLTILGGLIPPSGGNVRIDGADPRAARGREGIRLRMGFTFQFPEEQFIRQTVAEEFSDILGLRGVPRPEIPRRMEDSLLRMGLQPGVFAPRSPFSLSLGESRRLALALLIAMSPAAALLDEPTSGLDSSGVACAVRALRSLSRSGATVVIATHDVDLLAEVAGRVVILAGGTVAADGNAENILTDGALLGAHGYGVPEVVSVASALRREGRLDERVVLRLDDLCERSGVPPASAPS